MESIISDLGYESAKYLDERWKSTKHRVKATFSDELFKEFNRTYTQLNFTKRGRYYTSDEVEILQLAQIIDPSHTVVTYRGDDNAEPPTPGKQCYMSDISFLYNQTSHILFLRFQMRKRTILENGSVHI